MEGRIDEENEKKTHGKGGARPGADRPKGTTKEPTKQVRLPVEIADWFKVLALLNTSDMLYKHSITKEEYRIY